MNRGRSHNSYLDPTPPRPKLKRYDSRDVAKWDTPSVVQWFNTIEHGRFAKDEEYQQLRETLEKWSVKGSDLLQITHVWLKMLGVGDENDRNLILENIQEIAPQTPTLDDLPGAVMDSIHIRRISQMEVEKATEQHK